MRTGLSKKQKTTSVFFDEASPIIEVCTYNTSLKDVYKRQMGDYAKTAVENIRKQVGNGKVLLALSGGVDSSVVAKLLEKAVGSQLTCIFVDHGLMRKNEGDEVEAVFAGGPVNFVRVNAGERFLAKLAGVTEPEKKRKIIGEEFIRVFEEEGKKIGKVDFLAQGTIYPDVKMCIRDRTCTSEWSRAAIPSWKW